MRSRTLVMTVMALVAVLIATMAPADGEEQATEEQTVGVTVRTPGILGIDVDNEIVLGTTSPGTATTEVGFHIGIVNSTGEGWEVYVAATDFTSYTLDCDDADQNCVRTPTDPLNTIPASNLHIQGGMASGWAGTSEIAVTASPFGDAGIPLLLLKGTSTASGSFGMDEPQASLRLDVPASAPDGEYAATLTYTIMAAAP